ncbi:MAG: SRPBCC domain-containing protein [Chloracidobacterium sp.]|nr:SRPBCC domain-containing protein [Chloracidobacterium sp.]
MSAFNTSREIAASVDEVFAAFNDAERMARWWGPAGFTNTFHAFEFETGGRWVCTMHAPHGGNPENESVFELVEPPGLADVSGAKVVIRHLSQPLYRLTIELTHSGNGTIVTWSQVFDDAEVAKRIAKIVIPANEQNLDRLTAEVLK